MLVLESYCFYNLNLFDSRIHPIIHMLRKLWGKLLLLFHLPAQGAGGVVKGLQQQYEGSPCRSVFC